MVFYIYKLLNIQHMLFTFLKKQKDISKQKRLIRTMVEALHVPDLQKKLYFDAIEILGKQELDEMYKKLVIFVEKIEIKELEAIKKEDFAIVSWMRKKEAEEKLEEVNSFSFLLSNL